MAATVIIVAFLILSGTLFIPGLAYATKSQNTLTPLPSGTVTVATGASTSFVDNFNPFSPAAENPTRGMIYEPLFFFDTADAKKVLPWLATKYTWSDHGRTLTFQLRHGVTWTDGYPFTSRDVVFTFNLIKRYKELNQYGLPLGEVKAEGPYKVVVNFTKPAYADINYVAGLTYILPEHIWSSVKDPQTFPNTNPTGTGAYEVVSVSPSTMVLTDNPHYYMHGLPRIKTYSFEAFNGNTTANLAIESGQIDWSGGYIPDIAKNYLIKNNKFSISNIPLSIAYLVPNMEKGITTNYKIREALSEAINRPFISKMVYDNYADQINPESVLLPNFSEILDPLLKNDRFNYDIQNARKILISAGYSMKTDGYFYKNGKPLTITCKVVSGYTDYIQVLDIISSEEKMAGIKLVIQQEPYSKFISDQNTGNFQLIIDNFGYTPSPYVFFNNLLNGNIPPLGQIDTVGNFGRYNNPAVDNWSAEIATTDSIKQQRPYFYKIESLFTKTLPLIPLFDQQDEQEFNGNVITGEPTAKNPYAAAAVYIYPDAGWVAMHLAPVGK
ncbi:MAG: ABC transporter substrate-binding protein [Firmicutes bacterium]|nr:ABC transporter substrate-binding protein [Bacillota bacterium]